jgi:hypothetical protein
VGDFWGLIDQARSDVGGDWPPGPEIGEALTARLALLPLDEILAFEQEFSQAVSRAEQWELCAACWLILDYVSDDTFSDFKAALIGLGQTTFDQVVAEPDALADHPAVRAIAAGPSLDVFEGESIQFAAAKAYSRKSGDSDAFWDALAELPKPATETEPKWSGHFGSREDAARIPARLPRLHALFAARRTG